MCFNKTTWVKCENCVEKNHTFTLWHEFKAIMHNTKLFQLINYTLLEWTLKILPTIFPKQHWMKNSKSLTGTDSFTFTPNPPTVERKKKMIKIPVTYSSFATIQHLGDTAESTMSSACCSEMMLAVLLKLSNIYASASHTVYFYYPQSWIGIECIFQQGNMDKIPTGHVNTIDSACWV